MSEQANKEQTQNENNLIPKEELEKVTKEKDTVIGQLKSEIENIKTQLISPEYIEYLDSKKPKQPSKPMKAEDEVSLLKTEINSLRGALSEVVYRLELDEVEKKNPDFNEYRDDVAKIIEKNGNLNFEQAYRLAKQIRSEEKAKETPKTPNRPFLTEKPSSTTPSSSLQPANFKSIEESNRATLNSLREKYPTLGDTI